MRIGVIISAYNNAPLLRRCLLALTVQTDPAFEVIIADDGSNDSVRQLLTRPEFARLQITHVWHADQGFRRAEIMNRAITATSAEYLIMTDADCLPRDDFIQQHRQAARLGQFVSGGIVNIPVPVHQQFTEADILEQRIFDVEFLCQLDPQFVKQRRRLQRHSPWTKWLNLLSWRFAVLRGNNCAAWRQDLLAVNGFDQSFKKYGSEDRDLGIRLFNSGCRGRMLKYSLVAIHLDHPRPYLDVHAAHENRRLFRQRFWQRTNWIETGISSLDRAA